MVTGMEMIMAIILMARANLNELSRPVFRAALSQSWHLTVEAPACCTVHKPKPKLSVPPVLAFGKFRVKKLQSKAANHVKMSAIKVMKIVK